MQEIENRRRVVGARLLLHAPGYALRIGKLHLGNRTEPAPVASPTNHRSGMAGHVPEEPWLRFEVGGVGDGGSDGCLGNFCRCRCYRLPPDGICQPWEDGAWRDFSGINLDAAVPRRSRRASRFNIAIFRQSPALDILAKCVAGIYGIRLADRALA